MGLVKIKRKVRKIYFLVYLWFARKMFSLALCLPQPRKSHYSHWVNYWGGKRLDLIPRIYGTYERTADYYNEHNIGFLKRRFYQIKVSLFPKK